MTEYTFKSNFTTKIDFRQAKTPRTNNLTIVYLHGLYSDCWGRKPESIANWCMEHGFDFFQRDSHVAQRDDNIQPDEVLLRIISVLGPSVGF